MAYGGLVNAFSSGLVEGSRAGAIMDAAFAEQVHPFAVPVGFEEINCNVRRNYDFVRRNIVTHIVKSCSANLDIV